MKLTDRAGSNTLRLFNFISARSLTRAAIVAATLAMMMIAPPARRAQVDPCNRVGSTNRICYVQPLYDIAFLLDRSGSIAQRGQTYNLEVDGVIAALSDPTVIPRDGTAAISVFTFAGVTNLVAPLTVIDSEAAAQALIAALQAAKCPTIGSLLPPCPAGETSPSGAIQTVDTHLSQNRRPGARRAIVISTDGAILDAELQRTIAEATQARNGATILGIPFELDAVLVGLDTSSADFAQAKARVDQFVLPQPADALPGATLAINAGACNIDGASPGSSDCGRQATEFAEIARSIIRSDVKAIGIVVNSEIDTAPGAPVTGQTVSLRQALEMADCNGGLASISFASALKGKTIQPLTPLPAITQPDTVIDGCDGEGCAPSITIDGSAVDAAGGVSNGLVIRSNRTVIRGLRIINFSDSAIAIAPLCQRDNVLRNLIEKNVFENNAKSGISITNSGFDGAGDNTGNTISQNTFTGSPIPIDLGGDGPTANDAGDGDTGPNTLINFPDTINVVSTGTTVTVTGQINGPAMLCSKVEIYGVTSFNIPAGATDLVITGVVFLAEAMPDATGAFTATAVPISTTGIYTALVIDCRGNTSEMMPGATAARPMAQLSATSAAFGNVQVNSTPPTRQIQITNTGNAPLIVSSCALTRCGETDRDDTARFTISGCPSAPLNPGEVATITITLRTNICGPARVCLNLRSNDPRAPITRIEITGNVIGAPQARVTLEGGGSALDFGEVTAPVKPKKQSKQRLRTFTVDNLGCDTLSITVQSIRRTGSDVTNGKISNADDSGLFSISQVSASGAETPITPGSGQINITSGQRVTLRVRFNPVVPAVANTTSGLSASQVLPDQITSQINISQNAGSAIVVNLVARIDTRFRLINPENPRLSPVVTLMRRGLELTVEFSVYDSNKDVSRARYQFFDDRGRQVGDAFDINLTQAIEGKNLARGQSFRVSHRFGESLDSLRAVTCRITVFDSQGSQSATSSQVAVTGAAAQKR
jgi:hypothetical protein